MGSTRIDRIGSLAVGYSSTNCKTESAPAAPAVIVAAAAATAVATAAATAIVISAAAAAAVATAAAALAAAATAVVGEAARRAAGATSSLKVVAGASAGWGATAFVYSTPNIRQGGIRTGKCEEDTYTCSIPK